MKKTNKRKAFVASFDAIIALLITFFAMGILLNLLYYNLDLSQVRTQRVAMDVLTSLELTNSFFSPITVLSQTQDQVCLRIEVWNGNNVVASLQKHGCEASGEKETVAWRTFFSNGSFYTAKVAMWSIK